jgi:hypothetical protein
VTRRPITFNELACFLVLRPKQPNANVSLAERSRPRKTAR